MPVLVLDLLKYLFLAVLYIFVFRAVRAVYLELRPTVARRSAPARAPAPTPSRASKSKNKKSPTRAAVIEGDAYKGKSFSLGSELTIGRADKCSLVLDDAYVSQMHARIFPRGDQIVVEDLG